MRFILCRAGVVAAYIGHDTPDPARHHGIVEGSEGGSVSTTEHVVDVLMGETRDDVFGYIWDSSFTSIGIVFYRSANDALGDVVCGMFIEFNMRGASDFHFRRSRDDFGVEILS